MTNARKVVFDILNQQKYSNLELQHLDNNQDKAFITRLVYTCLQHYEGLVYQFKDYLKKETIKEVEIILVMATAQHFFFDAIEPYAIVDESVELASKISPKLKGLVNAIARKIVQSEYKKANTKDESFNLSVNTSHPLWITNLLIKQYGFDVAKQILEHHQTQPPLDIRINYLKIDKKEALETYPIYKDDYGALTSNKELFKTDFIKSGKGLIQDRNSQALINSIEFKNESKVLDCCCAPGTKLSQMALLNDCPLVGIDLHPHRIKLTRSLLSLWNIDRVELLAKDILDYQNDELFSTILADVPCSGLGVIRRKPDIKQRIQPEDLDSLQVLQAQILDHIQSMVKEGGQIIYSTCTLNKKENEKQIEAFLQRHPEFECTHQETLLGYQNNGDSFYMARLVKKPINMVE